MKRKTIRKKKGAYTWSISRADILMRYMTSESVGKETDGKALAPFFCLNSNPKVKTQCERVAKKPQEKNNKFEKNIKKKKKAYTHMGISFFLVAFLA